MSTLTPLFGIKHYTSKPLAKPELATQLLQDPEVQAVPDAYELSFFNSEGKDSVDLETPKGGTIPVGTLGITPFEEMRQKILSTVQTATAHALKSAAETPSETSTK